jgi:Transposase IS66 family
MLASEADRLGAQIDKLVAGATRYPPNRRLLNHLAAEREHLFTFLRLPGVQATNWRAEQAIRPAVVTRKHWGWQPHLGGRRHLASPHQRGAHRHPAGPRPHRAAGRPAASTDAGRGRPRHPRALTAHPLSQYG